MAKIHNIHAREIAAPVEVVGEILDTLGSADDRVWASDIWVAEPVVFDRPLAVGAAGGHGSIRYSVLEYQRGRRVVFRFSPGGELSGTHGFELEPLGPGRTHIAHFLDAQISPWMRPLVPILIGWHDAMVETALDRVELEATGSHQRRTRIPRWLRIANRTEIAIGRALGKLPPRSSCPPRSRRSQPCTPPGHSGGDGPDTTTSHSPSGSSERAPSSRLTPSPGP
jgi:hypothetical protein